MNKRTFPNISQGILLILLYFLPSGLFLFLTLTVPQLFGYQLPFLYVTINSIIAATAGLLPIIIYINRKSGVSFKWTVRLPKIYAIILLAFLTSSVVIITGPLNNPTEFINNLSGGRMLMINFQLTEIDLNKVIFLIGTVLITPVFEEILFRKQILGLLLQKNSPAVSIIISSVLFSLVHLRINDLVILFIWGILFGIVYYMTKSIEHSIILHSLSNVSSFIIGHKFVEITGMLILKYILILAGCLLVIFLILRYFIKNFKMNISEVGSSQGQNNNVLN